MSEDLEPGQRPSFLQTMPSQVFGVGVWGACAWTGLYLCVFGSGLRMLEEPVNVNRVDQNLRRM